MKTADKKVKAVCPTCGEDVELPEQYKVGQIISCRYCDTGLEILSSNPPVLDWQYILDYDTYLGDDVHHRHWSNRY